MNIFYSGIIGASVRIFSFFVAFLVCLLSATLAFAWPAKVVKVSDGDTIILESTVGDERIKIRLYGIDAPEKKQAFGAVARQFVISKCLYEIIDVYSMYIDRYKRTIAIITMRNGESLQLSLLEAGLAWVSPTFCKGCEKWERIQKEARECQLGLWSDKDPASPWEWRKSKKSS